MMTGTPLADILEKEWDAQLFAVKDGLATSTGWISYHTMRSKGSKSGYPDRTVVRDRILFAELKKEKAKPTDTQIVWLDRLARAGGEVYLWRPSDLDEIGKILSGRPSFACWLEGALGESGRPPHLVRGLKGPWVPRSIWVPGRGRADEAGVE